MTNEPGFSASFGRGKAHCGGNDEGPSIIDARQWASNVGTVRDWAFKAQPNPHLNGRVVSMSMGKVLGGGSSINGVPDPERRGAGGLVFIQPWPGTDPMIPATFEGVRSIGIPVFDSSNGSMMEGEGGCALPDMRIRNGQRLSIFRSYTFPYMDRPNWKTDSALDTPDIQAITMQTRMSADKAELNPPANSWIINAGLVRPKSRGHLRLTGADPLDPIQIEANLLSEPDDVEALIAGVELCRQIGNSSALRPFVKREVLPGNLKRPALENFVRNAALGWWHQTGTAKMGCDSVSVVDSNLKVYGIENLRIADASVMPRVTTGNTMAPCVIIGERAGEILRRLHNL